MTDVKKLAAFQREAADIIETLSADLERAERRVKELEEALGEIAKPKTGPDFDWSDDEANAWRARWYKEYEGRARVALRSQKPSRRQKADPGECETCDKERAEEEATGHTPFHPPHDASLRCESGGRNHCSCDVCF